MIYCELLDQLRALHPVALPQWCPRNVSCTVDEFQLIYVPFTVPFTCVYEFDLSFFGDLKVWLLEWDFRHRLSVVHQWTDNRIEKIKLSSEFEYLFVYKGDGELTFPWFISPFHFSNEILHEGFQSLLNEAGVPVFVEEDVYPDFAQPLTLEVAVEQDAHPEPVFGLTFEEQQRCRPKKYIAYQRSNYLRVLLSQIMCTNEFACRDEWNDDDLIRYLDETHPDWYPHHPHLPLFIRRYYQFRKEYRFYPFVYHMCRYFGGPKMSLTYSQYHDLIDDFKCLEKEWEKEKPRHNFPYFQLVIEKLVERRGIQWPYKLVYLKNSLKQIRLERTLDLLLARLDGGV